MSRTSSGVGSAGPTEEPGAAHARISEPLPVRAATGYDKFTVRYEATLLGAAING